MQRKYGLSRSQKFEAGEREKLLPLPPHGYSFGEWKVAKVHPDCHIQVAKNFYSVPHQLRGKEVEVRITEGLVEVYANLECVASHLRIQAIVASQYRTVDNHLPEAHRAMREAAPQMAIAQAEATQRNRRSPALWRLPQRGISVPCNKNGVVLLPSHRADTFQISSSESK